MRPLIKAIRKQMPEIVITVIVIWTRAEPGRADLEWIRLEWTFERSGESGLEHTKSNIHPQPMTMVLAITGDEHAKNQENIWQFDVFTFKIRSESPVWTRNKPGVEMWAMAPIFTQTPGESERVSGWCQQIWYEVRILGVECEECASWWLPPSHGSLWMQIHCNWYEQGVDPGHVLADLWLLWACDSANP